MDLYFTIKQQRKSVAAPVDTMGCAAFKDDPKKVNSNSQFQSNYDQNDLIRFRILVSLLLSSQTKDEVTFTAVNNLERFLNPLSPQNVLLAEESDLHKCIKKVGYHNKKLAYLIEISKRVVNFKNFSSKECQLEKSGINDYSMILPSSLEECLKLPGIGKKMTFLYLQHGFGYSLGIGVDTHVHRIANKIGLVDSKTPEQTRIQLERKFDQSEWESINTVLVGFGQTICTKSHPKCSIFRSKLLFVSALSMNKWYEPGEDSYTMVDLIKEEAITNSVVIDLGCSTDLNIIALQQLQTMNTIRTNLLKGINQSKIDVVIFNPPYVPDFDCSILGGGKYGRVVIDRFIEEVSIRTIYLLIIEANKPIEVAEKLSSIGYDVELKKVRKVVGETIIIFKCVKNY